MDNKKKTFKQLIPFKSVLMISLVTALVAVLSAMLLVLFMSVKTFQDQTKKSAVSLLSYYQGALSSDAEDIQNRVDTIYNAEPAFRILAEKDCSPDDKLACLYTLRTVINRMIPSNCLISIFNEDRDISIWQVGSAFNSLDFNENRSKELIIEDYLKGLGNTRFQSWHLYNQDGAVFLIYPCRKNGLYVAGCYDLTKFNTGGTPIKGEGGFDTALFSRDAILTNQDVISSYGITVESLQNDSQTFFSKLTYIYETADMKPLPLSIVGVVPVARYIRSYLPDLMVMLLVFVVLALLLYTIFTKLHRILAYPINKIAEASMLLSDPHVLQPPVEDRGESDIYEIKLINDALFRLVNQKVMLSRSSKLHEAEKEHAQLQYFQLQTKSHFFINCLKSLYNMLEMQQYDKMKWMIMHFSDHIRFVFHDNLTLIPLSDELAEVNDYASIIRMDAGSPLMLVQKVPKRLTDCLVPPLIIQTFLENSIKHNGQYNKLLRFVIECESSESEGKEYLRIKLSDNGTGYDPDVLDKLNFETDRQYEQNHVGISNLKRRMEILYRDDCNIAFLNGSDGGAVVMIYLPVIRSEDQKTSEEMTESVKFNERSYS